MSITNPRAFAVVQGLDGPIERAHAVRIEADPRRHVMVWELNGQYVENCSCDAICPCTWSNLTREATNEFCRAVLAFHVDSGQIEGVDVADRTVVLAISTPKMMVDGNWKAGLLIDEAATDEQIDLLTRVFAGQLGGPMAGLAPLITDFVGAERARIDLDRTAERWSLKVGDSSEFAGTAERGPDGGEAVTLTGIVAHPAGPVLTVTPGESVHWSLFGIDYDGENRSGFTAPFSWAA
ncbi:MAG: DUF1326 domain-containing protein [Ilumatobacteraceae bacterium]